MIAHMTTTVVTVYSRHGCHLCEIAEKTLESLKPELGFEMEITFIDGSSELEKLYGDQVPVIHIDGEHHDIYKVDPERFKASLEKHRQHQ
jgi:glutaredoxin